MNKNKTISRLLSTYEVEAKFRNYYLKLSELFKKKFGYSKYYELNGEFFPSGLILDDELHVLLSEIEEEI